MTTLTILALACYAVLAQQIYAELARRGTEHNPYKRAFFAALGVPVLVYSATKHFFTSLRS